MRLVYTTAFTQSPAVGVERVLSQPTLGGEVDDVYVFGGEGRSLKDRGDTPNQDELHLVAAQYSEDLVKPELSRHSVRGIGRRCAVEEELKPRN